MAAPLRRVHSFKVEPQKNELKRRLSTTTLTASLSDEPKPKRTLPTKQKPKQLSNVPSTETIESDDGEEYVEILYPVQSDDPGKENDIDKWLRKQSISVAKNNEKRPKEKESSGKKNDVEPKKSTGKQTLSRSYKTRSKTKNDSPIEAKKIPAAPLTIKPSTLSLKRLYSETIDPENFAPRKRSCTDHPIILTPNRAQKPTPKPVAGNDVAPDATQDTDPKKEKSPTEECKTPKDEAQDLNKTLSCSSSFDEIMFSTLNLNLSLPSVKFQNLTEILKDLQQADAMGPCHINELVDYMNDRDYIEQIFKLYEECKAKTTAADLSDSNALNIFLEILIVLLNMDHDYIRKELLMIDNLKIMIECYRTHPKNACKEKDFMTKCKFTFPIPFNDDSINNLIDEVRHLTYFVYLLPSDQQENGAKISEIADKKFEKVLNAIGQNSQYILTVLKSLRDSKTDVKKKIDIMQFLKEIFDYSRMLLTDNSDQSSKQVSMVQHLINCKILQTMIAVLRDSDNDDLKLLVVKLMGDFVMLYPGKVYKFAEKQYLNSKSTSNSWIDNVIKTFASDSTGILADYLFEIIKLALDVSHETKQEEKHSKFTKHIMNQLVRFLVNPNKRSLSTQIWCQLMDLLNFSFKSFKDLILAATENTNLFQHGIELLRLRDRRLIMASLTFLHNYILLNTKDTNEDAVKNLKWRWIVNLFKRGKVAKNAIYSKILGMIDMIKNHPDPSLYSNIREYFGNELDEVKFPMKVTMTAREDLEAIRVTGVLERKTIKWAYQVEISIVAS